MINLESIILKKNNGNQIPGADLNSFIEAFIAGKVNENLMTSFLRAVKKNGMTNQETISLTEAMINSGKKVEFNSGDRYVADKHSTGGVGDKVSLILGPILAAAGLKIPMLAGRSLGHTGGTIDKLETIPGFKTNFSLTKFKKKVESIGICIMSQTDTICPADQKVYALRDVTNTINSIPLICSSIMSKKIAEGISGLVLDIKIGNGAFMKTFKEGVELGNALKKVGNAFNINTDIIYSSMNQPLGRFAGMKCEVIEAIRTLKGRGENDVLDVVFSLGAKIIMQAGISNSKAAAISMQKKLISSGKSYEKFEEMVALQEGNIEKIAMTNEPFYKKEIIAKKSGYIKSMDTLNIGWGLVELGCGRKNKSDILDKTAGIEFFAKIGDRVKEGQPLMEAFCSNKLKLKKSEKILNNLISIGAKKISHNLFY